MKKDKISDYAHGFQEGLIVGKKKTIEELKKMVKEKKFPPEELKFDEDTYEHGFNHGLYKIIDKIYVV